MAAVAIGLVQKGLSPWRPPLASCFNKVQYTSTTEAVVDAMAIPSPKIIGSNAFGETASSVSPSKLEQGHGNTSEWKALNSKDLGLLTSMITRPTWTVLKNLRKKGYEAYLVGGCVRDLLLKKTPKDFDIITTADPSEIKKNFSRCSIVGRRFPICHVYIEKSIVEVSLTAMVSSFSTSEKRGNKFKGFMKRPSGCDDRDYARWKNCVKRDFTINGLMYDPYACVVYDYTGGMEDLRMAKVRTVIPAHASFEEDCARILRAIRIAARLGFQFTRDTARAIQDFSLSILRLDKARLMMEMNYMMAFGAAEASLRLLWRFGLLEILLPIQAAYLVSQGFRRRDKRSNMLLVLFANLDKLLAPDQPCHSSLWVGLLAFHLALVDESRDALVITAFALSVCNGGNLEKAVDKARKVIKKANRFCPEMLDVGETECDEIVIDQVLDLALGIKSSLNAMMDGGIVSQAMSKYPQAPFSDLVFITMATFAKVCSIFDCVGGRWEDESTIKQSNKINYKSLLNGDVEESRYVFAKIVLETVYSSLVDHQKEGGPS